MVSEMPPVDPLVRVFPVEKNVILIRAANLMDKFDTRDKTPVKYLDIQDYAMDFYA